MQRWLICITLLSAPVCAQDINIGTLTRTQAGIEAAIDQRLTSRRAILDRGEHCYIVDNLACYRLAKASAVRESILIGRLRDDLSLVRETLHAMR